MIGANSIMHEGRELFLVAEKAVGEVTELIYADNLLKAVMTLDDSAGTVLFVVSEYGDE